MLLSSALLSLAILPILTTTTARSLPIHTTYHRDITILGAGASGIYAARYWDHGITPSLFAEFNVSVAPVPQPAGLRSVYVDFCTGNELEGYVPPTIEAEMKAARNWRDVAGRYDEVLVPGFWKLEEGMPEGLVRPLGEFVEREGVENSVSWLNAIQAVSVGDVRGEPAFYVMGLALPSYAATGLLEGSEIVPTSASNSELYTKTAAWLGPDLLLNTRILEIRRPPSSCSCSPSS
ncbi:uncharacterized protein MYCGRDRAFT_108014 [Zymoseptoria tritici IPO323]|uniref:FAD/NAD(P)-binding domain-containing protein n=1 Tax=Zymoseptoria tritici (strain CBS 115943 / IPO323) TaxID=336722 RepID=F9X4E2_ZYMTI|nr:uncharacterized protein MYCGRDRAFT_108014 [Zymoseptoria tritici IPO323]EGP90582.1 hypothetical protein MYCGRDRAFT_108014 [Zymoseptoria tritici IPO323]